MATKTFFTHDNGGQPFKVVVSVGNVKIYNNYKSNNLIREIIEPKKVFIGKDIKNASLGGYKKENDGNSILINTMDLEYIFIGDTISTFTALANIITFISPVGNNDVPYPYAIDSDRNYYLIIEDVITKINCSNFHEYNYDPYEYYYNASIISNVVYSDYRKPIYPNFDNIEKCYIGKEPIDMGYTPLAEKHYNFLVNINYFESDDNELQFSIVKTDGRKYNLSKADYISLMQRFGDFMGFKPLIFTETIKNDTNNDD